MSMLNIIGIGETEIIEQGVSVTGTVTEAKAWWFVKVNRKPVRMNPMDGATFPHRIVFTYQVHGKSYKGSRVLSASTDCPAVGSNITVYYDPKQPGRYALRIENN